MLNPNVQVQNVDGVLVAEFWDCLRLDPAPVKELAKKFQAHLNNHGRPDLVIDMNGVIYAGSASLSGFLNLHRTCGPRGGKLIFCNVDETVMDVFRVTKLEPLFTFASDKAAALALTKANAAGTPTGTNGPARPPRKKRPKPPHP